jgi:hypothetical protein
MIGILSIWRMLNFCTRKIYSRVVMVVNMFQVGTIYSTSVNFVRAAAVRKEGTDN